jgi:hypothetical protein
MIIIAHSKNSLTLIHQYLFFFLIAIFIFFINLFQFKFDLINLLSISFYI